MCFSYLLRRFDFSPNPIYELTYYVADQSDHRMHENNDFER